MPELPDVETVRLRLIQAGLVGRTITDVRLDWPRAVRWPSPEAFVQGLRGRTVRAVERRAKYLLLPLDGPTLVAHLRMTGHLKVVPSSEPVDRMVRNTFGLDNGLELRFRDPRKLGMLWLADDIAPIVGRLGPEPLGSEFTAEGLKARLDRKALVKPLLLEQDVAAGVGNIYADEALWCAGIHPERPGNSLSEEEVKRLHGCLRDVLEKAIVALEQFEHICGPATESERGAVVLRVPREEGAPCPGCGRPISRKAIRGRSAYFCERCQR